MAIFAVVLVCLLIVWCLRLQARLEELETRFEATQPNSAVERQYADLAARLWRLEHRAMAVAEPPPPPPYPPAPPEARLPVTAPPPIPPERLHVTPDPEPVPPRPEFIPSPPGPSLRDRLRSVLGDQEWEMLVGGSLLNKAGALLLVVGIALFLGYSLAHVTAVGRALAAIVVSLGVLGAGIRIERRPEYQVFARGLIGAGWAALYATSYAIYALPVARIIDNPFTGSIGMLAVAIGMIGHSLRYRAQAVTGVAYVAAFAAMAVTPSTPFAVVSLIPLAASLLYIAARFEWYSIAIFGMLATYLACISRGTSGAPPLSTETLFLSYWLLFEAFDLLRTKRRVVAGGVEWLFPLNTAGFLGLSYLTWSSNAPDRLWLVSAFGAALFLADSILHGVMRPPSTFPATDDFPARVRAGSYEGSFVVSAVLAGLAIVGRVPGLWTSAGLALEAEIVYLAGLRLDLPFLRRLGARAFVLSVARIFWGSEALNKKSVLGHETWNWSPPALFHAFLFYFNRAVRRPNLIFSSAGTLLIAIVLAFEASGDFAGAAWALFGLALFETGLRTRQNEFRFQAYAVLAGATVLAIFPHLSALPVDWAPLAISLAAIYTMALRTKWMPVDDFDQRESRTLAWAASAASVLLAAVLLWKVASPEYLGFSWAFLALAVLELATRGLPSELWICFGPISLAAALTIAVDESSRFAKFPEPSVWITYFAAGLAASAATARLAIRPPAAVPESAITGLESLMAGLACTAYLAGIWLVAPDAAVSALWTLVAMAILELSVRTGLALFRWVALGAMAAVYIRLFALDLDNAPISAAIAIAGVYWIWFRFRQGFPGMAHGGRWWLGRFQFWAALLPVIAFIHRQAGNHSAPAGWIAVAVILLIVGNQLNFADARIQSWLMAALAFTWALVADIDPPRLWISGFVTAGLYAAQFLAGRSEENWAPAFFSGLGTLLVGAMLYGEVTGGLLTVSWGLEGLALLGCGFALRQRLFRLEGLALLLICILKLFLYDLRNLETIYRILSFIALGLILLAVSWIYSRFREHIRRLL
jgi:hypothetical protein